MSDSKPVKALVIDTSAFFGKVSKLKSYVADEKTKLSTLDLMVFEFVKLMQVEIRRAIQKKSKRAEMLRAVRDRLPEMLETLGIEIKSPKFTPEDLRKLYVLVSDDNDASDCMIWLKMQNAGLDSIITQNTAHWKKLGANAIGLSNT